MDIWSNFTEIPTYVIDAFSAVDIWFWPLIFIGIVGFLYSAMDSITVAVVGILITFGLFGTTTSIFEGVPEFSQFLYIVAIIGICLLIYTLVTKRRE